MMRWIATIFYRSENGIVDVCHEIEEICDLHDLVERGPDWNAIDRIEIRLQRRTQPETDTIEKAALR